MFDHRLFVIVSVFEDFEAAKDARCWDEEMEMVFTCLNLSKDALLLDERHLPTYLLARLTKCVKPEHQVLPELLRQAASPPFTCLISTQGLSPTFLPNLHMHHWPILPALI